MQSDEEIIDYIRKNGATTFHAVGTCKMGHDDMSVVDERLRVHGMRGLRVADASIMPTIISGNTSVPCMMIGEKCADMMLHDQELGNVVDVSDGASRRPSQVAPAVIEASPV